MIISDLHYYNSHAKYRTIKVKLDIINQEERVIDSFDGIAIDGSISISADSPYRRTGNITMVLDKKYNLIPNPSSKIWFNRRCAIHIGVYSLSKTNISWFNLGRFAIDSAEYDELNRTLSCGLKDYMSFFDGSLGGTLSHKVFIEGGSMTISEAIRSIVKDYPRVVVDNIKMRDSELSLLLPYDIEHDAGSTTYDLLRELVEMYMDYEMYFNVDGYFVVSRIKNKLSDPVSEELHGDELDMKISIVSNYMFENVKNSVYIWGYTDDDGVQYKWQYILKGSVDTKDDIKVVSPEQHGEIYFIKKDNKYVYVDFLGYRVTDDIDIVEKNTYVQDEDYKLLPFDVRLPMEFSTDKIGSRNMVISDNDIMTYEQSKLRAEYELRKNSNFGKECSISLVPLYYLDVNDKISIINEKNQIEHHIITSISYPLTIDGDMSMNTIKLYY